MPHNFNELVAVLIHPTQFPDAVESAMGESLRTRQMNHKFHYDTPKQTLRWLRLHEALAPARTDPDCRRIYASAFAKCAECFAGVREVEVVSLGCGGGQKDEQLLRALKAKLPGVQLRYVPVDASAGLTLTARSAAMAAGVAKENVVPVVVDLGLAKNWASALAPALGGAQQRIVCFFGMMPNFLPAMVLPQLAGLLRPGQILLASANLAPGPDYAAGVARLMPAYDNAMTRDWLWSVLLDLGLDQAAGEMTFRMATSAEGQGLLRIEASVTFAQSARIEYGGKSYDFAPGETFGLFYSYRHTPERLTQMLAAYGVRVQQSWINGSGEEGVFLCGQE
jgi:L-histidine Nalpha-methyltransferase